MCVLVDLENSVEIEIRVLSVTERCGEREREREREKYVNLGCAERGQQGGWEVLKEGSEEEGEDWKLGRWKEVIVGMRKVVDG